MLVPLLCAIYISGLYSMMMLQRGIQFTSVVDPYSYSAKTFGFFWIRIPDSQLCNLHMLNASDVQLLNWCFLLNFSNTCEALDPVPCARNFPSVITTIMDQKVQLLKSLNKRELNTT
jgi:hypothetical protein